MIDELYALDAQLVYSFDTIVKIGIQSMTSASVWGTPEPLDESKIISESLEIKQSICDDKELKIGGCIPSQLMLSVMDTPDLSGKRIVVTAQGRYRNLLLPSPTLYPSTDLYPNSLNSAEQLLTDEYVLFVGPIFSCKKTGNHKIRRIIAFDRIYNASTTRCKNRVYNVLSKTDTRYFSTWFTWAPISGKISLPVSDLINYNSELSMLEDVWNDIVDKDCTYLDFAAWLCELNGVFLIEDSPLSVTGSRAAPRVIKPYQDVGKDNRIEYYPISSYSKLEYEEFLAKEIRYVQFDYENGFIYLHDDPYANYSFYLSDNPLTKCIRQAGKVQAIVGNLGAAASSDHKDKITGKVYEYRPFKASVFNRWWVQVGDRISLPTNDSDIPYVESIVLSRTIKGMYGMTVEIEAKGVEILGKEADESINE